MDNDGDGIVTHGEPTPDVYPGKPINTAIVRHADELVIISESFGYPWSTKLGWGISGPSNAYSWRHPPEFRHRDGFPIGFLDGHAKSFRPVTHPNTDTDPPGGVTYTIYWADIPDNWWLIH